MNKEKLVNRIKVIMWSYLVLFEVLKLIGVDTFGIHIENERLLSVFNYIDSNLFLRILIPSMLCVLTCNILFSLCYEKYKENFYKLNICIACYAILLNLSSVFGYDEFRIILGIASHALLIILTKDKKKAIKVVVVDTIFTAISTSIRDMAPYQHNTMLVIFYMSDYYLLLILYKIGGFAKWQYFYQQVWDYSAKMLRNLKNKLTRLKQKDKGVLNVVIWLSQKIVGFYLKNSRRTWRYYMLKWKLKLRDSIIPIWVAYSILIATAWIFDKVLETVLFLIPYILIQKTFSKSFHADHIPNIKTENVIKACTTLSSGMFVICISNLLPVEVSLFSGIVVAIALDCLLYVLKDWLDLRIDVKDLREEISKSKGDFSKYGFSKMMELFAVDWLVNGLSEKELMIKHEIYSKSTLNSRKRRINEKMNTI